MHPYRLDPTGAGAETLASCMEHLSLESIDLNRNHVTDIGATSLGLALQRHGKCRTLRLQFNGVRDSGAMSLAMAVKLVRTLHLVDLLQADDNRAAIVKRPG